MSIGRMNREIIVALFAVAAIVGLLTAIRAIRAITASMKPAAMPVDVQQSTPDPRETARQALLAKILPQGNSNDPASPPVVVSVQDFFEGNNDANSIGGGLRSKPPLERFRQVLDRIAHRQNVQAVLVGIKQIDLDDLQAWPTSTTVYILAWAPRESVARWLAELKVEEVSEGYPRNIKPPAAPELMEDAKVYTAWWP